MRYAEHRLRINPNIMQAVRLAAVRKGQALNMFIEICLALRPEVRAEMDTKLARNKKEKR